MKDFNAVVYSFMSEVKVIFFVTLISCLRNDFCHPNFWVLKKLIGSDFRPYYTKLFVFPKVE